MSVKEKASKAASDVKAGAKSAAQTTRTKAVQAYDKTRDTARAGARRTGEGIEQSPFAALFGGIAIGALLGALIPRSRKEKELLADVGKDLNARAHGALDAAKEAGRAQLQDRGITPEAAESLVKDLSRGLGAAAKESASAATEGARKK